MLPLEIALKSPKWSKYGLVVSVLRGTSRDRVDGSHGIQINGVGAIGMDRSGLVGQDNAFGLVTTRAPSC